MSRSVKGGKGPGYEYWSRRPTGGADGTPGKFSKKMTHKAERQRAKREARSQA